MDHAEHSRTLSEVQLLILTWLSISLVFVILLVRFGLRIVYHRQLLYDDYLLILAFAITTTMGVMHTLSLKPLFAIRQGSEMPPSTMINFLRVQFTARILFWMNFYAVKASLLAFLHNFLHALPSSGKYWNIAIVLVALGAIASLVGSVTECTPIHRNFSLTDSCSGPSYLRISRTVLTTLTVWDVFTDLVIITLPLPLLISMRRSLTRWQLISLASVFCSGGLIVIFALLRLGRIWRNKPIEDLPWQITIAVTWSQIEAAVAIFVGSLPAFKVFFTRRSRQGSKRPNGQGPIRSLLTWTDHSNSQGTAETAMSAEAKGKAMEVQILSNECK